MHSRFCPNIVLVIALLALSACSRPAIPGLSSAPTPQPASSPTAQSATRTPARPTPKAAASQPTTIPTATAPTATPSEDSGVQTTIVLAGTPALVTNGGNVRDAPVTGKIIDQIHAKETVRLFRKNAAGTWYRVITPRNVDGWVSATLLNIDPKDIALIPVDGAAVPSTPAASTAAPAGWKTHTIGQNTLQVPSSWQSLPLTKADLEQAVQVLAVQNPAFAQAVRQLITSGAYQQMKFFAIGQSPDGNVNVIEVPRPPGISADALLAQALTEVPKVLPNSKVISSESKHQVHGLPAARLVYDLPLNDASGKATILRGVQWYIVDTDKVYIITISGPPTAELSTAADQIGQSFTTHATAADSAATVAHRQIIHGGNLRQAPKVAAANVIGQVCPGDQVSLLDRPASAGWTAIHIEVRAADCDPKHVPLGAEGWVSNSLLGPLP